MPLVRLSLLFVALAACYQPSYEEGIACGADSSCPEGLSCRADSRCWRSEPPGDSGTGVLPIDASAGAADSGPPDSGAPDASPVACRGDGECASPPTLCQLAGTCDLENGTCVFPDVDCSSLDGECSRGSCDQASGACTAQPINQDTLCGAGETCGAYGACGPDGVGDVCDQTGVQSRSCTLNTCQAGTCVGVSEQESSACTLDTTGAGCGESTVECGQCGFQGVCDESGSRACTCTSYACAGGACAGNPTSCPEDCTRDTDGLPCFGDGTCVDGFCEREPCPFCLIPGWSGAAAARR